MNSVDRQTVGVPTLNPSLRRPVRALFTDEWTSFALGVHVCTFKTKLKKLSDRGSALCRHPDCPYFALNMYGVAVRSRKNCPRCMQRMGRFQIAQMAVVVVLCICANEVWHKTNEAAEDRAMERRWRDEDLLNKKHEDDAKRIASNPAQALQASDRSTFSVKDCEGWAINNFCQTDKCSSNSEGHYLVNRVSP